MGPFWVAMALAIVNRVLRRWRQTKAEQKPKRRALRKTASEQRDFLRRIGAKDLRQQFEKRKQAYSTMWNGMIQEGFERARFSTAYVRNIEKYGKLFIASFPQKKVGSDGSLVLDISVGTQESPVALSISNSNEIQVNAKLGFSNGSVIVEALQGPNSNKGEAIKKINQRLGTQWPNFLLAELEQHARGLGFRTVSIRNQESGWWHHNVDVSGIQGEARAKISARIEFLRKRVEQGKQPSLSKEELEALKGFKRTIQNGKIVLDPGLRNQGESGQSQYKRTWENYEIRLLKHAEQMRIRNFYAWVAKNNGYQKKGNFFVKAL